MLSGELLSAFQEVGADLYRFGLVTSHGGNLSVREGPVIWITGTGRRLGYLRAEDLSRIDLDGAHLSGPAPSSDTDVHLAVYKATGAQAVVHAHAPHAVALSYGSAEFVPEDVEGSLHLGSIPVVAGGLPRDGMAEQIAAALGPRRVVLLEAHGAYARGEDLWQALHWVMALEESARIAYLRGTAARRDN